MKHTGELTDSALEAIAELLIDACFKEVGQNAKGSEETAGEVPAMQQSRQVAGSVPRLLRSGKTPDRSRGDDRRKTCRTRLVEDSP